MSAPATTPLADLLGLLRRSADHLLAALPGITEADLDRPTPCPEWDLRALLLHVADSAVAFDRLRLTGTMEGATVEPTGDPVAAVRRRVQQLVADLEIQASGVDDERTGWAIAAAQAGAIEFAGHGWDLETALGTDRPIPVAHGNDLLGLCHALLPDSSRPPVFGPRIELPDTAAPSDRFAAYLGRARG